MTVVVGRLRLAVAEASVQRPAAPPVAGVSRVGDDDLEAIRPLLAPGVDAAARLAQGDLGVLARAADGRPIGIVWWALRGHPDGHLGRHTRAGGGVAIGNQFLVAADQRGRGVGRDLLDGSLQILREEGIARARLLIGLRNAASRASASRAGFVEVAHVFGVRVGSRSATVARATGGAPTRARRKQTPLGYARRITRQVTAHPSNRGHAARALLRASAWQLWKRIGRRPVDVHFRDLVLRCHPDSQSASNVWYFTPRYDHHEMLFLERYLRPGDDVLDIGANIGTYTLLAASLTAPDGRITAFEPDPANAARIRENVSLNGLEARVDLQEAAVTSEAGEVEFAADHDVSNAIRRPGHRPAGSRTVRAVRIDQVDIDASRLAVAKMDVEGAEVDALRGAEGLLSSWRPPVLLVEVLAHQLAHFDTGWDDLLALLAGHGYRPWSYDADTGALVEVTAAPKGNCTFVADTALDDVRSRLAEGQRRVDASPPPVRVVRGGAQRPRTTAES